MFGTKPCVDRSNQTLNSRLGTNKYLRSRKLKHSTISIHINTIRLLASPTVIARSVLQITKVWSTQAPYLPPLILHAETSFLSHRITAKMKKLKFLTILAVPFLFAGSTGSPRNSLDLLCTKVYMRNLKMYQIITYTDGRLDVETLLWPC